MHSVSGRKLVLLLRAPSIRFSKPIPGDVASPPPPMFRRFTVRVFILSSPEIRIALITFNYQLLHLPAVTIIHTRAWTHYLRVTYYSITLLCATLEYLHNIINNNIILNTRGAYVVPCACVIYVNIYAVRTCKN